MDLIRAYTNRTMPSSSPTTADIDSDSPPNTSHPYHQQQYPQDLQQHQNFRYPKLADPNQSTPRRGTLQQQHNRDPTESGTLEQLVLGGRTRLPKNRTGSKRSLDMDEDPSRESEGGMRDPLHGRKIPRIDKERKETAEEIDELDDDPPFQPEVDQGKEKEREKEKPEALRVEEPFDPTAPVSHWEN